jgi:hypothetical protein
MTGVHVEIVILVVKGIEDEAKKLGGGHIRILLISHLH